MSCPLLITFEGPEGGGKSTQIGRLANRLTEAGCNILVTRQPGGDPVGNQLRAIMLDIGKQAVAPRAELLMMMADRAQSVERVIRPHLATGGIVLCDRYIDSSTAYQGYGRGLDIAWIDSLNAFSTNDLRPDITFLLDIEPSVGLLRQNETTRMEMENISFHERVRNGYLEIVRGDPERFRIINAAQPLDAVFTQIFQQIVEAL